MNDQEQAQRVGEIMIARHTGKTIIRTLAKIPSCSTEIAYDEIDFGALCEHPERYSIKKEPRVVWVNVFETLRGKIWSCHCETEEAAKKMVAESERYRYEAKTLAEAHPIELPE